MNTNYKKKQELKVKYIYKKPKNAQEKKEQETRLNLAFEMLNKNLIENWDKIKKGKNKIIKNQDA